MNEKLLALFERIVNADNLGTARTAILVYLAKNGGFVDSSQKFVTIELLGNYDLPARVYCEIACLLASNKKIPAIKMLRAETGFGLKEVKEAVENYNNWPIRVDCIRVD